MARTNVFRKARSVRKEEVERKTPRSSLVPGARPTLLGQSDSSHFGPKWRLVRDGVNQLPLSDESGVAARVRITAATLLQSGGWL